MSSTRALNYKNRHVRWNTIQGLRRQSGFKVGFILCFALGFELLLFLLFADGFRVLSGFGPIGQIIITQLFSLFFLGMGLMLATSGLVTSYASLYRSPEIPFLLTRPFTLSGIVTYKFSEAMALSSWAFFFILLPFAGAYAWHQQVTPLFALWTFAFSLPLIVIFCGAGMLAMLLLVRYLPRRRWILGLLAALLVAAPVSGILVSGRAAYNPDAETFNLSALIPGLSLASNRLIPSWWVSEGILAMLGGQWLRGALFGAFLVTSAMLVHAAVELLGQRVFFESWHRVVESSGSVRRAERLFPFLDRWTGVAGDVRAMLAKDLRTFLRDPMQWSQALVFFGLLALYFSNLRMFRYHVQEPGWRNTIAFLNVFSVSAVLCSLGSRFVYPQLSLEGQGFWMIGLAPTSMRRVLATKFGGALVGLAPISVGLILLSSSMLRAEPAVTAAAAFSMACITLAVCGLSVGLGAVFMDLDERNPAAIVSGFGGTLNLALTLAVLLAVILPFGFLFYMRHLGHVTDLQVARGLWLCAGWGVVVTIPATALPLAWGVRTLARRDF